MQQMHKAWAQKGWAAAGGRRPPFLGAAEGRPPSFVHLLHCFYLLFACFALILYYIFYVRSLYLSRKDNETDADKDSVVSKEESNGIFSDILNLKLFRFFF